jgi:hypothetical protein
MLQTVQHSYIVVPLLAAAKGNYGRESPEFIAAANNLYGHGIDILAAAADLLASRSAEWSVTWLPYPFAVIEPATLSYVSPEQQELVIMQFADCEAIAMLLEGIRLAHKASIAETDYRTWLEGLKKSDTVKLTFYDGTSCSATFQSNGDQVGFCLHRGRGVWEEWLDAHPLRQAQIIAGHVTHRAERPPIQTTQYSDFSVTEQWRWHWDGEATDRRRTVVVATSGQKESKPNTRKEQPAGRKASPQSPNRGKVTVSTKTSATTKIVKKSSRPDHADLESTSQATLLVSTQEEVYDQPIVAMETEGTIDAQTGCASCINPLDSAGLGVLSDVEELTYSDDDDEEPRPVELPENDAEGFGDAGVPETQDATRTGVPSFAENLPLQPPCDAPVMIPRCQPHSCEAQLSPAANLNTAAARNALLSMRPPIPMQSTTVPANSTRTSSARGRMQSRSAARPVRQPAARSASQPAVAQVTPLALTARAPPTAQQVQRDLAPITPPLVAPRTLISTEEGDCNAPFVSLAPEPNPAAQDMTPAIYPPLPTSRPASPQGITHSQMTTEEAENGPQAVAQVPAQATHAPPPPAPATTTVASPPRTPPDPQRPPDLPRVTVTNTHREVRKRALPRFRATFTQEMGRYLVGPDLPESAALIERFLAYPAKYLQRAEPLPSRPNQQEQTDAERDKQRKIDAACRLASQCKFRKANLVLNRQGRPLEATPETVAAAQALFPQHPLPIIPPHVDITPVDIDTKLIGDVIKNLADGKAPGPSGWTEDLLLQLWQDDSHCQEIIAALVRDVVWGVIPVETHSAFRHKRFVGIEKAIASSVTSIQMRPIGINEALVKVAGAVGLRLAPMTKIIKKHFDGIQHGLDKCGCERVIHEVQSHIDANPGDLTFSVDGTNAFNAFIRQFAANALFAEPDLASLWPSFRIHYASESTLDFGGHILRATGGSSQGDPPASLYFCLAVQPLLNDLKARYPTVRIKAIIDDINIQGPSTDAVNCFIELRAKLATIGLQVNMRKTRVYSQDIATAERAAAHLGIHHERDGLSLLGAFVSGNREWIRQQLLKKADSYDSFFENLALLPPPAAFPMLQTCVVSKWTYVARTHSYDVARDAHCAFDNKVRQAFRRMTACGELSVASNYALHLPMREGGLGLPSFELIGGLAYAASRNSNVGGTQEMLTIQHDHKVIEQLHTIPGWAEWLMANRKDGSSLWIRACKQIHNSPGYASALLLRIRAFDVASPSAVCPHCKVQQEGFLMLSHILGCARQKGIGPATRHSAVLTEVIAAARTAGLPVVRELSLNTTPGRRADAPDLRMDAVIETETKLLYVDVTLPSTTSKTHREDATEKDKQKKYLSAATTAGAELTVFRVDALGGFSNAANAVCRLLTDNSCLELQELKAVIAWRIAMHNGLIYRKWAAVAG